MLDKMKSREATSFAVVTAIGSLGAKRKMYLVYARRAAL